MRTLVAFLSLSAFGCMQPAMQVHGTDNANIEVEQLFTHDGCKVFRFRDGGYHYFVRCDGATSAQTLSPVSCGKGCVRDEVIATAR